MYTTMSVRFTFLLQNVDMECRPTYSGRKCIIAHAGKFLFFNKIFIITLCRTKSESYHIHSSKTLVVVILTVVYATIVITFFLLLYYFRTSV